MQFYMKMFREINFNVYNFSIYKTIMLKITLIKYGIRLNLYS